ncbi:type IV pilin protein [Actimicrobium sp. CCI2.3]|uniref:type IV pilin protein n=1 Tax=Actimicrobium sp. CCI2.3 TaxID=3048616 RepID=UPI002AB47815|nr:type IV pilin protein [Actimicrobium sp. CCI2.3]MDY7574240.1 type IV pilin protein [Actimicrobium sp. CCI2.3]MEB0022760.1 type IV pilin protein [Actimicrobium sp. CCI2.3]
MRGSTRNGFTLIELMIAVAVMAILTAIAYPSYVEQVNKSRRAEAKSAILQTASLQERFYTLNNTYSTALLASSTRYTITVTTPATDTYTITAVPLFTDDKCGTLTYDQLGTKTVSGSADLAYCW